MQGRQALVEATVRRDRAGEKSHKQSSNGVTAQESGSLRHHVQVLVPKQVSYNAH